MYDGRAAVAALLLLLFDVFCCLLMVRSRNPFAVVNDSVLYRR